MVAGLLAEVSDVSADVQTGLPAVHERQAAQKVAAPLTAETCRLKTITSHIILPASLGHLVRPRP